MDLNVDQWLKLTEPSVVTMAGQVGGCDMFSTPFRYSLLMLTHNRRELVERCLISLAPTLTQENTYLQLLDNGSTDGTAEWLQSWLNIQPDPSRIEIILCSVNLGVATGRQYLVTRERQQPHEIVVFLDSDVCIMTDDWLDRLSAWLMPDDIGLVGPGGHDVIWDNPPYQEFIGVPYGECDVVSGYCQAFKGELLARGVDLDPAYGLFWHEDSDMCMQIRQLGYRILSTGPIGIAHVPGNSGAAYVAYEAAIQRFRQKWQGKRLTKRERADS